MVVSKPQRSNEPSKILSASNSRVTRCSTPAHKPAKCRSIAPPRPLLVCTLISISFVCAVATASVNHARRLRTYNESTTGRCTIVEAARATSAAPTFFEPVEIMINGTKERFVDGALGFNNPVMELYSEAKTIFPSRSIDCIVSLGTGSTVRGVLRQPRSGRPRYPRT